jgi:hypothetical protein
MALTVVPVFQGQNLYIADCVFTVDGDLAGDVAHGLGVIPLYVSITPTTMVAATVALGATVIDATKVTLAKIAGAGTAAGSAVRVEIRRPHSIMR